MSRCGLGLENEPEALYTVVSAEGGGLALVAAAQEGAAEAYGFEFVQPGWRYPPADQVSWDQNQ